MPRSPRGIRLALFVTASLLSFSASPLRAQPGFEWPSHPKNLKVLPKDLKPEQLSATMIGFTRALGVRCPYCHVGEEGKPLTTFDFASDTKPQKEVARDMVVMLGHVKKDLGEMKLVGTTRVNVGCVTCHHGHPRPTTLSEELMATYDPQGIDSTLAAYQRLRARYYGRDAFDFGEGGLVEFAGALSKKGRSEDAIRILKLNAEQYPSSPRALEGLASGYEDAGQKDLAIETYRKLLEIEPENRNAKRHLGALQGAPK